MPEPLMQLTPRALEQARTAHPLFRFARPVQVIPGEAFRYHPVPTWAEIPGPYDAILQFRDTFAARVAARGSTRTRIYELAYAPESLTDEARQFVVDHTPVERLPWFGDSGVAFIELELEPTQIRFALGPNRVSFVREHSTEVRLEWELTTTVVYRETTASVQARSRSRFRGFATPPVTAEVREVEVDRSTLQAIGVLRLDTTGGRYHVQAYADVAESVFSLAAASPLSAACFGALIELIQPGFGRVPVTPQIVLPGYQGGRVVDVDLGTMHPYLVVTNGNRPGEKVLNLCIAFGDPVPDTHLSRVRPFCADRQFAFYQSDRLALTILRRRWNTLPAADRTTIVELDLPLLRDGQPVTGSGRIEARIGALLETELETAVDHPDFVKAIADIDMRLLEAADETGAALDVEALGLAPSSDDRMGIAYDPFAPAPADSTPVNRFIDRLLTTLLHQMFRPFHYTEAYRVRDLQGHVSEPLGALFLRANPE